MRVESVSRELLTPVLLMVLVLAMLELGRVLEDNDEEIADDDTAAEEDTVELTCCNELDDTALDEATELETAEELDSELDT